MKNWVVIVTLAKSVFVNKDINNDYGSKIIKDLVTHSLTHY